MMFFFERHIDLGEFGEHLFVIEGKIIDQPERQISALLCSVRFAWAFSKIEISEMLSARVRLRFEDELIERYLEQKTD